MAPQGLAAMLTMPLAGALSDKYPVGRIVPFGLLTITGGMFSLTRIDGHSSYWGHLIPTLFVMGLGMGMTMMPLMTSAIKTLTAHQVARGTTLLNITQQVASSIGVAIMSVVLTNGLNNSALISQARGFGEAAAKITDPGAMAALLADYPKVAEIMGSFGQNAEAAAQALQTAVRDAMGLVFAHTFTVAFGLIALTLIPALFLPRKREESHLLDDEGDGHSAAPVLLP